MPFDDEDTILPLANPSQAAASGDDVPSFEDTFGDETQDFRLFAALADKKGVASKSLRKGEKDFEPHGTKAQDKALEASRHVMEEVLSYTRVHQPRNWVRGWYFPDRWKDAPEEGQEGAGDPGLWKRDRVVVLEHSRGPHEKNMGRVPTGEEKDAPARGRTWLLPEEALYLVERGGLDLWWPAKALGEIFNPERRQPDDSQQGVPESDYELGTPLSLQAAYALLIGLDGERGKISLERFQVYSNLKRIGYIVLRATPESRWALSGSADSPNPSLWQWLFSLLSPGGGRPVSHSLSVPLVKPGLYRSYQQIYSQLAIIPRHKPTTQVHSAQDPQPPFKVFYHLWKAIPSFSKARPPPPSFRIAVVDARTDSVPDMEGLTTLLDSTPWDPPDDKWNFYKKLKHGYRNVVIAVVDNGIVNYIRFCEAAFGEDLLHRHFDRSTGRGAKKGGARGGRGGRGGKGRGRGRR